METNSSQRKWLCLLLLVGGAVLANPALSYAQRRGRSPQESSGTFGGTHATDVPQPYGGQLYCPVEGVKLGLRQPPIEVPTTIGEQPPSFFGKMIGKKGTPGAVIYSCCPECAEKVRQNPRAYLEEVIADKGTFSFNYASAPGQRPPRGPVDRTGVTAK